MWCQYLISTLIFFSTFSILLPQSKIHKLNIDQLYKKYNNEFKYSFADGKKYAEIALKKAKAKRDTCHIILSQIYLLREKIGDKKYDEATLLLRKLQLINESFNSRFVNTKLSIFHSELLVQDGKYNEAIKNLNRDFEIKLAEKEKDLIGEAYYIYADAYRRLAKRNIALTYCKKIFELETLNEEILCRTYPLIAIIYKDANNIEEAIKYFHRGLQLSEKLNSWRRTGKIMSNLGELYSRFGNIENALEFGKKSFQLYKSKNYTHGKGYALNLIGMTFFDTGIYDSARHYFNSAKIAFEEIDDFHYLAYVNNNIGEVFINTGKYDSAKSYCNIALEYAERSNNLIGVAFSNLSLGKIEWHNKNYKSAIQHFEASTNGSYAGMMEHSYNYLSELYAEIGDSSKALQYLKMRNILHDSSFNAKTQALLVDKKIQYDLDQKERELQKSRKEQKKLTEKFETSRNVSWVIVAFGIMAIGGGFFYYRQRIIDLINKINVLPQGEKDKRRYKNLLKAIETQDELNGKKKNIDENLSKEIIKKLEDLMKQEEIFLNSGITLAEVAKELDTNTTYLSRLINEYYEMNFSNYINKHRIEKAKMMILKKEQNFLTFEGIANNVGFTSKSAFNTAFKKFTGKTPSEFAKSPARPTHTK